MKKKFFKILDKEVVFLGFPDGVLEQVLSEHIRNIYTRSSNRGAAICQEIPPFTASLSLVCSSRNDILFVVGGGGTGGYQ